MCLRFHSHRSVWIGVLVCGGRIKVHRPNQFSNNTDGFPININIIADIQQYFSSNLNDANQFTVLLHFHARCLRNEFNISCCHTSDKISISTFFDLFNCFMNNLDLSYLQSFFNVARIIWLFSFFYKLLIAGHQTWPLSCDWHQHCSGVVGVFLSVVF